jgi:hypothetical protein
MVTFAQDRINEMVTKSFSTTITEISKLYLTAIIRVPSRMVHKVQV